MGLEARKIVKSNYSINIWHFCREFNKGFLLYFVDNLIHKKQGNSQTVTAIEGGCFWWVKIETKNSTSALTKKVPKTTTL